MPMNSSQEGLYSCTSLTSCNNIGRAFNFTNTIKRGPSRDVFQANLIIYQLFTLVGNVLKRVDSICVILSDTRKPISDTGIQRQRMYQRSVVYLMELYFCLL